MKIDRRLNLVLEVERMDGTSVHVHHVPIAKEVYDAHWAILHDTVNALYMKKYLPPMAVRTGMKMLLSEAERTGVLEAVQKDLLPHIWKTTTLIVPGSGATPMEIAMASKSILDAEDIEEVQNYLVFFTAASWVHPRKELGKLLYPMLQDSGALFGSWSYMEFVTSLQTAKKEENSGEKKEIPLSVPH